MRYFEHKMLSSDDMTSLAGTATMEQLVRHRLIVMYGPDEKQPTFNEIGCNDLKDIFYMHRQNDETLEFFFYSAEDLETMKEKLTVAKLAAD